MDSSISADPPPAIALPSSMAAATTRRASCRIRSTSSTTCSVPPRIKIETARAFLHPVTKVMSSVPTFRSYEVGSAEFLRGQVVQVRDAARAGGLRELLHVAFLHPPDGIDALFRQVVLGHIVDALLGEDDVRARGLDLLYHGSDGLLFLIEEQLHLRGIAD